MEGGRGCCPDFVLHGFRVHHAAEPCKHRILGKQCIDALPERLLGTTRA